MAYISILIPIYNSEDTIIEALDSIPVRDDIEIIVANDSSTDTSLEILKNYKNKKIVLLDFKLNHGVGFIRNRLLEKATGTWISWLDSDDYFYPEMNTLFDSLYSYENYDCIWLTSIWNNGRKYDNVKNGLVAPWTRIYKREIFDLVKFPEIRIAEDLYFEKALEKKKKIEVYRYPIPVYHYNFPNKESLSSKRKEIPINNNYIKNYLND